MSLLKEGIYKTIQSLGSESNSESICHKKVERHTRNSCIVVVGQTGNNWTYK